MPRWPGRSVPEGTGNLRARPLNVKFPKENVTEFGSDWRSDRVTLVHVERAGRSRPTETVGRERREEPIGAQSPLVTVLSFSITGR
jgi:hypothetical protein